MVIISTTHNHPELRAAELFNMNKSQRNDAEDNIGKHQKQTNSTTHAMD